VTWRAKPTKPTVCAAWLGLLPGKPVGFWISVGKRVRERRVRHADLAKVKAIAMEIDDERRKRRRCS